MRRMTRLPAALLACLVMLLGWASPAHAVGNAEAARKSASYLASQSATVTEVGLAADVLLGLLATGDASMTTQTSALTSTVKGGAQAYAAKGPEAAAKLAILASALGEDPRNFAGLDLVGSVKAGLRPDGSFGSVPGAEASALGMIALARANEQVPTSMLRYVVRLAGSDGGFGSAPAASADAESTAWALLALGTQTDSISARAALLNGAAWASAQQHADGSWRGGSTIRTTALMASALQASGLAQPRAISYLASQQLADGSLAEQGKGDLTATAVGALALADTSYAGVSSAPTNATSGPSTTASPGAIVTAAPEPAPNPMRPLVGDSWLWILQPVVLLGLLAATGYYLFIRPTRKKKPKPDAVPDPPTTNTP